MPDFREWIADARPRLFDGAMGTLLYARGVPLHRCYDELSLTDPELVRLVHEDYARAGADILETNTYGANPVKLARYGLEAHVHAINARAAELARRAAGDRACVAGAIGPLGVRIEPYGPTSVEEAQAFFRSQVEGLLDGGVDLFVLETFSDLLELQQALQAVRAVCDLPVVAQVTVREDGRTTLGTDAATCLARLTEWGADVVGFNCSIGPSLMLDVIERARSATDRPLSAQPNAGLPKEIEGRTMYLGSPEHFAQVALRLVRHGVRFVGGCCGTTPEHIARMANALRIFRPTSSTTVAVRSPQAEEEAGTAAVPLAQRSRWGAKLAQGAFLTTVEVLPPRGADPTPLLEAARQLHNAGVDAVNLPDGPRAQSRMSALLGAVLVHQQVGLEPIVHYCCRDRNLLGMLSDLLGAHALGVRNLLLITGDPPKMGPYPDATGVFDIDSIGLTNLVARLNRGLDPGGNPLGQPTSFVIGVGVNPTAEPLDTELRRFFWKIDAGAEFAITQPVFDVDQFLAFLEELDRRNLRLPLVAGIWPLASVRNAEFLANEVPGVRIPEAVLTRMRRAGEQGGEAATAEGVAIAQEMLERLRPYIQGVQISAPFGRVGLALRVLEALPATDRPPPAPTPAATR
jgi:homocysteine S-methyltransferase